MTKPTGSDYLSDVHENIGEDMPINKDDIAAWEEALESLEDFEEQERAIARQLEAHDKQNVKETNRAETGIGQSEYPTDPPPSYQSLITSANYPSHMVRENWKESENASELRTDEEVEDESSTSEGESNENMTEYQDDIEDDEKIKRPPDFEPVFAGTTSSFEPASVLQEESEPQMQQPSQSTADLWPFRYSVSKELNTLFKRIEQFVVKKVEIQPVLRPFSLEYIPAVGDVDPFVKVIRPDDLSNSLDYFDGLFLQIDTAKLLKVDELQLGLVCLDEPAAAQSDPAIMDLRLHQLSGKSMSSDAPVKKIGRVDRNSGQIDHWIQSVREIRHSRPSDRVHYTRKMPDIESLMQEWPRDVELSLDCVKQLLSANLDLALEEYVDLCLSIVDIPVYKSRLESLHMLFSLFNEFKNSQHFQQHFQQNLALNSDGALQTDATEFVSRKTTGSADLWTRSYI